MPYKILPYNQSLSLLTDLYQLTMSYGYFKSGVNDKEAVFNLFFRKNPFNGGFTICCGLEYVIDYIKKFTFDDTDIAYLSGLKGNDGNILFEKNFLKYLKNMTFSCDIDAIPEGTVVFPFEPLVRVQGPIIQCQILETILLNIINFQSLIATKAARMVTVADSAPIMEFGLRRAQGMDGALAASRAAYIGGCAATSNVLAGKIFDIPVKGTHAHSWVMSFDDEMEAFKVYAKIMPNNCVFLVDTYDTLEGIKKAVEVGKWLRSQGHEMAGVRLDSGDLAYLSQQARKILDEAGFSNAKIVASNDIDESIMESLKEQHAKIDIWGIGTKLITAFDQPALGGVYKLAAIRSPGKDWEYKVKLSEQSIKVSNPGILQVRRYYSEEGNLGDVIYEERTNISSGCIMIDPMDMTRQKRMSPENNFMDLLIPVFRGGEMIYNSPNIHEIRKKSLNELNRFQKGIKRFINPHQYPVGLEKSLFALKTELILKTRECDLTSV